MVVLLSKDVYVDCEHCKGTGKVKHECTYLNVVRNHPLNKKYSCGPYSEEGFIVKQCPTCKRVWGIRYQYGDGTGSDNRYHDYGIGDPLELAKEAIIAP